jgi:hypothetical protein
MKAAAVNVRLSLLSAASVALSLAAPGCGTPAPPTAARGSSCDTTLRASYAPDALACCRPLIAELASLTDAAFPPPDAAYSGSHVQLPTPTSAQRNCCVLAIDVLDRSPRPPGDGYATPEDSCCLYIEGAPGMRTPGPFCSPGGRPKPIR